MANIQLFDLARMTVSSTGTGTITLNAAVSGFNTFDAAGCSTAATGQAITYAVNDTTQSEMGPGTYYSSALHVVRASSTTGLKSTNGNSPIDMSNTAQVFITPNAADLGLTGQIPGTTTNDSASTGNVGEYVEAEILSGAAVGLTNAVARTITTLSLTAGDWDVWGVVSFTGDATTNITFSIGSVSDANNALPVNPGKGAYGIQAAPTGTHWVGNAQPAAIPTGVRRFSIATSTTVYLVGYSEFSVSFQEAYGIIAARRSR